MVYVIIIVVMLAIPLLRLALRFWTPYMGGTTLYKCKKCGEEFRDNPGALKFIFGAEYRTCPHCKRKRWCKY